MPDEILTPNPPQAPTSGARPYWLPDTRGFLAFGIWLMITVVVIVLLIRPPQLDEKASSLLYTILGILIGCFKDVYGFSFNSTQASEDKNRTIDKLGTSLATSVPLAANSTLDSNKE